MRIPTTTYRIQFHSEFNFERAKQIIPYLAELGITDLYASPIFKARDGSTHGYDVVDPNQINPELGTEAIFQNLLAAIAKYQMGWLQDIVPNHMAYDSQNEYLMDVLENGSDSQYYSFFDIAWDQPFEEIQGRVLAPMLGNFYGESLENGEIRLSYDEAGLNVNYYSLRLPIRMESYAYFITHNLGHLTRILGRNNPDFIRLLGILYLSKSIADTKGKARDDQTTFIKNLLWELYQQNPEVQKFIEDNLNVFNGEAGNPESFNLLDALLSDQFYRLAFWKVGAEEINYRRFFTVNELISVRVEDPRVFKETHALICHLVKEEKVTGLRIDHVDGLYDPTRYFQELRENLGDTYITVEKILELAEELPDFWPVQGTSGYDFLNRVNGVLCQIDNEDKLDQLYRLFSGVYQPYEELVIEKKALIEERNLAGDVDNLARLLKRISAQTRKGRDFTLYGLKRALVEILTLFPVYRTYISAEGHSDADLGYINTVIEQAKERDPLLVQELSYIKTLFLLEFPDYFTEEQRQEQLYFVMRLQQLTGPLMAKGVEDTLFYVYNRLISLNEVGGNPGQFGISLEAFHEFNRKRCDRWPEAMSATATHDTKRGEDARARINVLSEIPEEWEQNLFQWRELNRDKKKRQERNLVPSTNDEYFFYQAILGGFPFEDGEYPEFVERVKACTIKAIREAKVRTAWLRPDTQYEEGCLQFVEAVLSQNPENTFLESFLPFQKKLVFYGILNSLSQVLLKFTAPGIADVYQGTELWDLSFVDPDNRRPVDYQRRQTYLQEIKAKEQQDRLGLLAALLNSPEDGKIKLYLSYCALQARKAYAAVFQRGNYHPLLAEGSFSQQIIAFQRTHQDITVIAIAPRFYTSLVPQDTLPLGETVWQDTQIKLSSEGSERWKNLLTGEFYNSNGKLEIGKVLQHFPVALLVAG